MSIGRRFKKFRIFCNLTQTDISRALKLSGAFVSNIENDKANPSHQTLIKLVEKYNLNVNWLLTGDGDIIINDNNTNKPNPSSQKLIQSLQLAIEENSRLTKMIDELMQKYVIKE